MVGPRGEGSGTWLPALNSRSLVHSTHTSHCGCAAGRGLEPKSDSPPGLNVYKYWNIKACQHDCVLFPLIHTLNSYGDYSGESLPYPSPVPLTPCPRQHYLWAGGHFVLLISALRYFLATITLKAVSSWWYKGAWLSLGPSFRELWLMTLIIRTVSFTGALISYVIVCQSVFSACFFAHLLTHLSESHLV